MHLIAELQRNGFETVFTILEIQVSHWIKHETSKCRKTEILFSCKNTQIIFICNSEKHMLYNIQNVDEFVTSSE